MRSIAAITRLLGLMIISCILLSMIVSAGFRPVVFDSDSDGLSNYEEMFVFNTNPYDWDTDNDHLGDGDELTIYFTDPLDQDMDSDRLYDSEIILFGTSPFKADSDYDGLTDYEEVNRYNTDPNDADSDSDMYHDYNEILVYGTDPLNDKDYPMPDLVVTDFYLDFFEDENISSEEDYPRSVAVTIEIENQGNYKVDLGRNLLNVDYDISYNDYEGQIIRFQGLEEINFDDTTVFRQLQAGESKTVGSFLLIYFDRYTHEALINGEYEPIEFDGWFEIDSTSVVLESDEANNEYSNVYPFAINFPTISVS